MKLDTIVKPYVQEILDLLVEKRPRYQQEIKVETQLYKLITQVFDEYNKERAKCATTTIPESKPTEPAQESSSSATSDIGTAPGSQQP